MTAIPRPEHPFPQFERKDWVNLNGDWEFEIDWGDSGKARGLAEQEHLSGGITVPFCPESPLSGVGVREFMDCVWYKRRFTLPDGWKDGKILLHFGAVDYHATVWVNGVEAGQHKGGYASFALEITGLVREGENLLTVCAEDHLRSHTQPSGKQSDEYASAGCLYTRTTGIWQTVWLEYLPKTHIASVRYYPDPANGRLTVQAQTVGSETLHLRALYEGRDVGDASARSGGGEVTLTLELSETHLWEPGQGRLYDLELTYGEDRVKSYFGLRSTRLDGVKYLLNDRPLFQRTVLDQGFYPDGIYTAPDESEFAADIKRAMEMGFNGARLHQKVFEPRFLYHCDKMGYLVWGEHANWGLDITRPASIFSFLPEWLEIVERDFNHPSIIGWCPFNETTKENLEVLRSVYRATKAVDPTRPCIDTSGYYHIEPEVYDMHDYNQDPVSFRARYEQLMTEGTIDGKLWFGDVQPYHGEPVFVSEYGGIKSTFEEDENAWGYGNGPKNAAEFLERFRALTEVLLENDRIFGLCYTQLTDVEQEQNGLYTYDRKPKLDPAAIRAILTQKARIEEE